MYSLAKLGHFYLGIYLIQEANCTKNIRCFQDLYSDICVSCDAFWTEVCISDLNNVYFSALWLVLLIVRLKVLLICSLISCLSTAPFPFFAHVFPRKADVVQPARSQVGTSGRVRLEDFLQHATVTQSRCCLYLLYCVSDEGCGSWG